MTAVACTLVSLCVCLTLARALPVPAAKRLPLSHDHDQDGDGGSEGVLAGSDFLSVFMGRSARGPLRPAADPFEPHHYDRDLNSVANHKSALLDIRPYPQLTDKYTITNIFKTNKYGYAVEEEDVKPTQASEVKTTTQFVELTTAEDILTTGGYVNSKNVTEEEQTTNQNDEDTTTTTQQDVTEKVEEKVISVRVSSSVARHSHRLETSTAKSTTNDRPQPVEDNLVTTLVTQEQPTITAVQRSDFGVEETDREPKEKTYDTRDEVEGKVEEVPLYGGQQPRAANGKLPVFEIHFHNPPAALISSYGERPEVQRREDPQPYQREDPTTYRREEAVPYRRKEFRQLSLYGTGRPEAISYQTRVSSDTSDSNVKYYREHPVGQAVAETVNQPVVAEPYQRESTTYHEEPQEQSYGEPEKVYGHPEENYEVDEAVSVITNGKAHGVQAPTPPPGDDPAQNKFGYVVEGRNYRKYRVEERTADGFIVGEYGVVSHDDGSLRGVRYTADSTINPRLIYDTLVKFLSLK